MRQGQGTVIIASLSLCVEGGSGRYANPCHRYRYKHGSARPYLYPYPCDTHHVTHVGYLYLWYSLFVTTCALIEAVNIAEYSSIWSEPIN